MRTAVLSNVQLKYLFEFIHGGESRDILHLYSDRTGTNIRNYFFNTQ